MRLEGFVESALRKQDDPIRSEFELSRLARHVGDIQWIQDVSPVG